jgi:RNA polymerase sigma factor (sigma-70 family)
MDDEAELLGRFVEDNDQEAFAGLVRRHVNLVYAAALRQVAGDTQLAENVTQDVFLALAQKAPGLMRHPALSGWLYTTTRFIATKSLRAQRRWEARQLEAHMMQNLIADDADTAPDWCELRPVIDEAMHELPTSDREVILLRYFEGHPLAELGVKYGLVENSVRMRVERALDRLRLRLARRGITSTVGALGVALAAQPVVAAPVGLAAAAASTSLAGLAAGGSAAAGFSLFAIMSTTKISVGVAVLALAGLGYVSYQNNLFAADRANEQRQQNLQVARLREENRSLRKENRNLTETVAAAAAPTPAAAPEPAAPPPAIAASSPALSSYTLSQLRVQDPAARLAGFRAGILRSHAEIFQKLGMSESQQEIYIQMRFQHMNEVNQISADAQARGADPQAIAALQAQSSTNMWDNMRATFGDAAAAGLQEFVAAGGGRGGAVAAAAAPIGGR